MLSNWSNRANRWLRRGPPKHYRGPEAPAILQARDWLRGDEAEWRAAPRLAEPYFHSPRLIASPAMLKLAEGVAAGEYRVASRFPVQPLGLPPDWGAKLIEDDNWCSSLHSLEWLIPLLHAHAGQPEAGYLRAAAGVIEDWIRRNPFRGAPSRWSWHDHAVAKRLRLFAWFWEHYRTSDTFEEGFARLLFAGVWQHAAYQMEARNYRSNSNHGLEAIGAQWAAALTFPFVTDAPTWERTAAARLEQWIGDNLSPEGFHLEQSPAYHWFVLIRLAALDRFLRANQRQPDLLAEATERAARVWPHLLKPDGALPTVGDSGATATPDWPKALAWRWGREAPPPAESTAPGGTAFLLSPRAGYAILRSSPSLAETRAEDTYVLFRCRAFESPHCHYDALSFVLSGLGRDWVVDSGYLSYHEWDPRRQYLRSPRAHSLVTIGEADFRTSANELVEWGRGAEGDFVASSHDLPAGRHTRRLLFTPPHRLTVTDQVQSARRTWTQLFQVAPDLQVEIVSDREARLIAEAAQCVITQDTPGQWQVMRGQAKPRLQGWYSESYGKWAPGITLAFSPTPGTTVVVTQLALLPDAS